MLYKLYYLNARARGELIRLIFAYKSHKYEDFRINWQDWSEYKKLMPVGKVPVLEINDGVNVTLISQSKTIGRYLANRFGIAGTTDLEKAKTDEIVDQLSDEFDFLARTHSDKDKERKSKNLEVLNTAWIPRNSEYFEKTLKQNSSGFLVGHEITWADLALMNRWDFIDANTKDKIFGSFPLVKKHDQVIRNNPQISEWLRNRPSTKF